MKNILSRKRTMARVATVQALYRYHLTSQNIEQIVREFCNSPIPLSEEKDYKLRDPDFFAELVEGVIANCDELDQHIEGALAKDWTLERMEMLLKDILRAAIYEMAHVFSTPGKVIINEYVDITALFYEGTEPKIVNAMLDKVGHDLRKEEFKK